MLREWIIVAAAIVTLPTDALAQVQSGVRSGVQGGVRSGFDHYNSRHRHRHRYEPIPYYSPCWRSTVIRGRTIVWNCQPYPPP